MKSGASSPILLWLLVAVIGLFAFRSVDAQSSTSELGNLLLPSESIEQQEDEMAGGRIRCCNRCDNCLVYSQHCRCLDPDRKFDWVPESACSPLCVDNILLTGETLGPGNSLRYGYVFMMQKDCDLVLFDNNPSRNVLFSSETAGKGTNCTLSFMDDGRLAIDSNGNKTLWTSPNHSYPNGSYAAILRRTGEVAIYGPIVWRPPNNIDEGEHSSAFALQNVGLELHSNVLFSGQSLYDGDALRIPNFRFELCRCNLALIKFTKQGFEFRLWESHTHSSGWSCFARLNDHGQLSIFSESGAIMWSSSPEPLPREGEYALVLTGDRGSDAKVAIFGRKAWSTARDRAE